MSPFGPVKKKKKIKRKFTSGIGQEPKAPSPLLPTYRNSLLSIFRPGQDAKLIVFSLKNNKKDLKKKKKKKKKKNKQCYHCFFIDRLCRLLSIFRPGQDAKLIVFFKINKKEPSKVCSSVERIGDQM